MPKHTHTLAAALTAAAVVLLTPQAHAQDVMCNELENPVYIQAGSTVIPLLTRLGQQLRDSQANPMTLVFVDGRSCSIIDAVANDTPQTINFNYVPSSQEDPEWTPDTPPRRCIADPEGVSLDLGHSDIFPESCGIQTPDSLGVFDGPVLPFVFVTPPASSQVAITAEEAYFAWGFGQAGGVTPWTDESFLFTRPNTSGTKITFGAHIGVPAARWKGQALDKTSDVINAVSTSINAEATLGIVGGANYDANRDTLKSLAFAGFGQQSAWYPDSNATSFDKRNVRDGHYLLWAPAVFMTNVDDQGEPTDERVDFLLDLLRSQPTEPQADFDATGLIVDQGFVPSCAMEVSRQGQAGDLSLFTPQGPCGCFFEDRVGADHQCTTCDDDTPCDSGRCIQGFCQE
mgnify:CR=1 FL=1